MNPLQLYAIVGLPIIALVGAAVSVVFVRKSGRRVDLADARVTQTISTRRQQLDRMADEGVDGLVDKVVHAAAKIPDSVVVHLRRFGE